MVRESKMTPPTIIYVRIYADPKAGMSNSIFYTGLKKMNIIKNWKRWEG